MSHGLLKRERLSVEWALQVNDVEGASAVDPEDVCGGYAAIALSALAGLSFASPGYHYSNNGRSVTPKVWVCGSIWAPRRVHCIYRRLVKCLMSTAKQFQASVAD